MPLGSLPVAGWFPETRSTQEHDYPLTGGNMTGGNTGGNTLTIYT